MIYVNRIDPILSLLQKKGHMSSYDCLRNDHYVRITIIVKNARGGLNGCMYQNARTNELVFIVLVDWRTLMLSLL